MAQPARRLSLLPLLSALSLTERGLQNVCDGHHCHDVLRAHILAARQLAVNGKSGH